MNATHLASKWRILDARLRNTVEGINYELPVVFVGIKLFLEIFGNDTPCLACAIVEKIAWGWLGGKVAASVIPEKGGRRGEGIVGCSADMRKSDAIQRRWQEVANLQNKFCGKRVQ